MRALLPGPLWPLAAALGLVACAAPHRAPSVRERERDVVLNAEPLGLLPNACREQADCEASRPYCFFHEGPVCGGAAVRPCVCGEGEVAEGLECGRCRCVPDCRSLFATPGERQGEECDRSTGRWRPIRCDAGGAGCGPLDHCSPADPEADAKGCVRRTCESDVQCPRGNPCVFGRCRPGFGTCVERQPDPPP